MMRSARGSRKVSLEICSYSSSADTHVRLHVMESA